MPNAFIWPNSTMLNDVEGKCWICLAWALDEFLPCSISWMLTRQTVITLNWNLMLNSIRACVGWFNHFVSCVDYKHSLLPLNDGRVEEKHGSSRKRVSLFKYSLCSRQGMAYLHSTELKSHGSLKSSNCLIDSRWTLKISDFGLTSLKSKCNLSSKSSSEGKRKPQ